MDDDKPFQCAENPPPPMHWDDYEAQVKHDWINLLDRDPTEVEVQQFLELHPCLVPFSSGPPIATGGHYPFPCAVVSQPVLTGIRRKIPDFMWIAKNSMELQPVLIEVEAPAKRWFNRDGTPTADLTQAIDQLNEWKAWLRDPENQLVFFRLYRVPSELRDELRFNPQYVLVYGRRKEFDGKPDWNKKRAEIASQADTHLMTYDRLVPNRYADTLLSAKFKDGTYTALHIPPTFTLGDQTADWLINIEGREDAIRRIQNITEERREFLLQRTSYWDRWVRLGCPSPRGLHKICRE